MDTHRDLGRSRPEHAEPVRAPRPEPAARERSSGRDDERVLRLLAMGILALALIALIAVGLVAYLVLASSTYLDLPV